MDKNLIKVFIIAFLAVALLVSFLVVGKWGVEDDPTSPSTQPSVTTNDSGNQPSTTDPDSPTNPDNPVNQNGGTTTPTNPSTAPTEPTPTYPQPTEPENKTTFTFTVNGCTYKFGQEFNDVLESFDVPRGVVGWLDLGLSPELDQEITLLKDDVEYGEIYVYNNTDSKKILRTCPIYGFEVSIETLSTFYFTPVDTPISADMGLDIFFETFGEPIVEESQDNYTAYGWLWRYDAEYSIISIAVNYNTETQQIEAINITAQSMSLGY